MYTVMRRQRTSVAPSGSTERAAASALPAAMPAASKACPADTVSPTTPRSTSSPSRRGVMPAV